MTLSTVSAQILLNDLVNANGWWANEVTAWCAAYALDLDGQDDFVVDLGDALFDDGATDEELLVLNAALEARAQEFELDKLTDGDLLALAQNLDLTYEEVLEAFEMVTAVGV